MLHLNLFKSATCYIQDRVVVAAITALTSGMGFVTGILTDNETRWIGLTTFISFPLAVMLSMGMKKLEETLQMVLLRAFLTLCCGILGPVPIYRYMNWSDKDGLMLLGCSFVCACIGFSMMLSLINQLIKRSDTINKKLLDKSLVSVLGDRAPAPTPVAEPPSTAVPSPE